jgi:hypothetical protein
LPLTTISSMSCIVPQPKPTTNWWPTKKQFISYLREFDYLIIPYAHIAQLVWKSICVTTRTCVILKSQRRACHACQGHAVTELSDTNYCSRGFPKDVMRLINLQRAWLQNVKNAWWLGRSAREICGLMKGSVETHSLAGMLHFAR